MYRHSMIAAALLALVGGPLWADSQEQRRNDSQDRQTQQQLRAYLGVGVSSSYQEGDQQEEGVTIDRVSSNSPAARAGLRKGDVITQIGRRTVEDFRDLSNAISRLRPGEQVSIQVQRDGRQRTLHVTLASDQGGFRQDDNDPYQQETRDTRDAYVHDEETRDQRQGQMRGGLDLQRLLQRFRQLESRFQEIEQQAHSQSQQRQYGRVQEENGEQYQALQRLQQRVQQLEERLQQAQSGRSRQNLTLGIQGERTSRGLRVTDLDEDSPAMESGLRRGDVIVRVAGRTVTSTHELRQAMRQARPGQEVTVEVVRNGQHRDLEVGAPQASRSQARGYQRLQQRVEQLESRIREMEEE